jgi:acyl-CoA hydrolase
MEPQEVVTVDIVTNPVEAEVVANTLRAEGIACTVEGGGQAGVVGNTEMRILVHAWDADRARRMLKAAAAVAAPTNHRSGKVPKKKARTPRGQQTKAANNVRRQRISAKARRGVSPT